MLNGLNQNVRIRLFLHFVEKFMEGAVAPFFVIYFASRVGDFQAGLLLTLAMLLAGLASLYGGHLADLADVGRRKVLVPTECCKALALTLLAVVCTAESFFSVLFDGVTEQKAIGYISFVLYFVVIVCHAAAAPVSEAIVLDNARQNMMRQLYGYLYWITNFARSIGTLTAMVLYEVHFGFVLLTCSIFAWAAFFVVLWGIFDLQKIDYSGNKKLSSLLAEYKKILSDKVMVLYITATTLNYAIAVQLGYYIAVRLSQEFKSESIFMAGDWAPVITGVMMFGILRIETNLIVILFAHFMQRWTMHLNAKLLFVIGPLVATVSFSLLMFSNNAWVLILAMAVYTFGELLYLPAKMALISRIAPQDARSRYTALRSLDFRLALMIGAAGVMAVSFIPSWFMSMMVIAGGGWIIVLLIKIESHLSHREQQETLLFK